ncbi:hypothetical protein N0V93_003629 [Gnomoniopsis smithogilvyi]|uniref:Uncharacterized protein n=1 Tax=Gnomoniopsis smithogilvyi TaxID=1191159 RepID=A0A9W8YXG9_9PEZI|nr:hypothetical protein N0V93_003629 [Gnomoniopsis smithogilvyi]
MPRFAFGKRRSTAEGDNEAAPPSFRVLDRSEVNEGNGKSFDGGVRLSAKQHTLPRTTVSDLTYEDDLFADYKPNANRGSGSSNTTKTNSTDNSSRHSNASTTPSSADLNGHEDWKLNRKSHTEGLAQTTPRPTSILKSGRSWSFGGSKKHQAAAPTGEADVPDTPAVPEQYKSGRARATTASTDATITPPHQEPDLGLDLGGSFSKLLLGFDKRSSAAMSVRDENGRQVLQPSAITGGRINAPSPIQIDRSADIEPPQHSWASHRSNDDLLGANENTPPPVPKHGENLPIRPRGPNPTSSDSLLKRTSAMFSGRRKSTMMLDNEVEAPGEGDDLNSSLLAVSRFMSDTNSRSTTPIEAIGGRQKKNEDTSTGYKIVARRSPPTKDDFDEEDNLFDNIPLNSDRLNTPRQPQRKAPEVPAQTKVMTPLEFEKYRKDKEVASRRAAVDKIRDNVVDDEEDEEDDNYEDDEDEAEKSRQLAKQRRKQEAHMSVYRQQMMKVTGDSEPRPPMMTSFSTPNLTVPDFSRNTSSSTSDAEDDEEVPLAILAAHGFPNKNRPPTRLNNMMSNPNLRQAAQPSYQRPSSAAGQAPPGGGALPPFARGLPTDPYGLVNPTVRESFALGGGMPAGYNPPPGPAPNHGGLVGVIASEERARSLRRGSPQVHQSDGFQGSQAMGPGGFDPMQGIPHQMMYPQAMQAQMQEMQHMQMQTMMSPGEQAQVQLSQQMSQFMQMQMQFMQMMASNNKAGLEPPRSAGHASSQSLGQFGNGTLGMGMNPGASSSFLEPPMMDARGDGRTMSMVQPNSTSWLQPPPGSAAGYAGSIRGQGYAPSIAPSERSNVGLPGRYRPVSNMPPPASTTPDQTRKSFISGALSPLNGNKTPRAGDKSPSKMASTKEEADDDDDEGWAAMKAKRDQKKSSWRIRKTIAPADVDIGSLIT